MLRPDPRFADLPGAALVANGMDDLNCSAVTPASLILQAFTTRLGYLGLEIPPAEDEVEPQLYALLQTLHPTDAHLQLNALFDELESFMLAAEQRVRR